MGRSRPAHQTGARDRRTLPVSDGGTQRQGGYEPAHLSRLPVAGIGRRQDASCDARSHDPTDRALGGRMVRRINTGCVVAAITSGFICSVQATPQGDAPANTAANGATSDLSEVVVTAQLRSQPLQDVPVSVSVVTGDTLARVNLTSIEAVSARLPDVKIVSGPLTDLLNIRGVGSGQNSGFEQSVGTFVDGLY